MIELNDDKTLFFFDRDLEPVLTVKSGETIRIRTKDCFSNQLTGPQDAMDDLDWDAVNPATGPVFVEGAKAGGALKVRIDNIEFDEQTCSATGQDEGVCGNRFTEWATHYCKIQGNTLAWDERLNIPLRPMIGVIGVAPEGEPVNWRHAGQPWRQHGQHGHHYRRHAVLPRCGRRCAVRLRRHARGHGRRRGQRLRRRGCGLRHRHADGYARAEAGEPADRERHAFRHHRVRGIAGCGR